VGAAAVLSAELGQVQISADGRLLYFADSTANRVRAVELATRRVFTIAGNSTWAPPVTEKVAGVETQRAAAGYRDGAGATAVFNRIKGIALSPAGDNLFTTENPAGVVRAIAVASASPTVSPTPSASPSSSRAPIASGALVVGLFAGVRNVAATPGDFCAPATNCNLASSNKGNIGSAQQRTCTSSLVEFFYVEREGCCVRFFSSTVGVVTVAGSCSTCYYGRGDSVNGRGDVALFRTASSIVSTGANGTGDLIVLDGCGILRKISMSGFNATASNPKTTVTVSTLAGNDACGYKEGTGIAAKFLTRLQLHRLSSGEIMVLDYGNLVVRLVAPMSGKTTLLAGTPGTFGNSDGFPNTGRFNQILAATEDYQGSVYILDLSENGITRGGREFTLHETLAPHNTRPQPSHRTHTRSASTSTPPSPSATPYQPCDERTKNDPRKGGSPARRAAALARLCVHDVCCSPATLSSLATHPPHGYMATLALAILCRLWVRKWRPYNRAAFRSNQRHTRLSRWRNLYRELAAC
jgi:hypothetical protein